MQLYLVSWATRGQFEAEKDDSSMDCVADMAAPNVAMVLETMTDDDLRQIYAKVEEELSEELGMEEDDEELPLEPQKRGFRFEPEAWVSEQFRRPFMKVEVYDKADNAYEATIIVQKVETGH